MDSSTGKLYETAQKALDDGVDPADLVMLEGPPEAVRAVSDAVKAQRRKRNKAARAARKRNR